MQSFAPLLTVASIWLVAAVSPGPNFLLTAQVSATRSRTEGLAVVCGIGVATAIWGWAGLTGVEALFRAAPWFYLVLKVTGAAYLIFTGVRLIIQSCMRPAKSVEPPPDKLDRASTRPSKHTTLSAFRIGLVTSLANPRSALSVASIFAAALPDHSSITLGVLAIIIMVAISVSWYSLVAFLLTTGIVASAYRRLRRWIDRVAGAFLIWFGANLALSRT